MILKNIEYSCLIVRTAFWKEICHWKEILPLFEQTSCSHIGFVTVSEISFHLSIFLKIKFHWKIDFVDFMDKIKESRGGVEALQINHTKKSFMLVLSVFPDQMSVGKWISISQNTYYKKSKYYTAQNDKAVVGCILFMEKLSLVTVSILCLYNRT